MGNTEVIRCECILENILSHLTNYSFTPTCIKNTKENNAVNKILQIVDHFKKNTKLNEIISDIESREDSISDTMSGIGKELFSDKITWYRFIAFLTFSFELGLSKRIPHMEIYNVVLKYYKNNLQTWVLDHSGWACIF